jgi:hypothetical protein
MLKDGLRYAVVGSFDLANAYAPIIGAILVFVVARISGLHITSPTDISGNVYLLLTSLIASWMLVVLGRFIYWPWRQLSDLHRASPLEVFFDSQNGWFCEWGENPNNTPCDETKYGEFYLVEVVNHGHQTVEGIRVVYSYDGQTNRHAAFGTDKSRISLDPNSRKMVKLFFQSVEEYVGEGEFSDPFPRDITVYATARDTLSSPPLRLHFQPTGKGKYDDSRIYDVSVIKSVAKRS